MEDIIQEVARQTNLPQEQARLAVEITVFLLKRKLPAYDRIIDLALGTLKDAPTEDAGMYWTHPDP